MPTASEMWAAGMSTSGDEVMVARTNATPQGVPGYFQSNLESAGDNIRTLTIALDYVEGGAAETCC